ncbi:MAG TPA: hypothetical protein PKG60_15350 [Spirochaetota bacterium]|nr:hypothetical protein [Spirochaetota bacterium]HPS88072.1 hypothetical protein [Spirochaetota bacterium]
MRKYKSGVIVVLLILSFSSASELFSKEKEFLIIDPDKISRYNEDRIVYQRVEKRKDHTKDDFIENNSITIDNSVENLLIIKDRKIHFIVDGYDLMTDVQTNKIIKDSQNKYLEDNDFWLNKINGRPDYIRVIYRRSNLMMNSNEEFVTTNFGTFYKSVRDRFVKMHVDKFRQLLRNRGESKLTINKYMLSYKVNPDNSNDIKQKFFISAKAKANDGTVYYCEDADGDGITETFTATRDDGFDWGINSGPNLLSIMGNSDKDLETFIGKLANESVHGTVEEEKKMFQQFPTEKDVLNLMDQVTPMDQFYE